MQGICLAELGFVCDRRCSWSIESWWDQARGARLAASLALLPAMAMTRCMVELKGKSSRREEELSWMFGRVTRRERSGGACRARSARRVGESVMQHQDIMSWFIDALISVNTTVQ